MTPFSDKDEGQFQTIAENLEKPKAQISRARGLPIGEGWKWLSWALALFTFAVSVQTFVEYHPVRELVLCAAVAVAVFGVVRLGFQAVNEFYERSPRDPN